MHCLACHSEAETQPAAILPFIQARMFQGEAPACELASCPACGFAWFTARPSPEDARRFYRGYRGEFYQIERQHYEPDYTAEFNASLEQPPTVVPDERRVLDYGGDGRYLTSEVRYAFNIDGAPPATGVVAWVGQAVDAVLCCNVLEHVAEPVALVERLRKLGRLYIEVPVKRPTRALMHEHINFFTPESLRAMTGAEFTVAGQSILGVV